MGFGAAILDPAIAYSRCVPACSRQRLRCKCLERLGRLPAVVWFERALGSRGFPGRNGPGGRRDQPATQKWQPLSPAGSATRHARLARTVTATNPDADPALPARFEPAFGSSTQVEAV